MPLSNLISDFTKPSPLKAAIRQIRLTLLIKANVIAIKVWLPTNFVVLRHTVGKDDLFCYKISPAL